MAAVVVVATTSATAPLATSPVIIPPNNAPANPPQAAVTTIEQIEIVALDPSPSTTTLTPLTLDQQQQQLPLNPLNQQQPNQQQASLADSVITTSTTIPSSTATTLSEATGPRTGQALTVVSAAPTTTTTTTTTTTPLPTSSATDIAAAAAADDPASSTTTPSAPLSAADSLKTLKFPVIIGGGLLILAIIICAIVVCIKTHRATKIHRKRKLDETARRPLSVASFGQSAREAGKALLGRKRTSFFDTDRSDLSGAGGRRGAPSPAPSQGYRALRNNTLDTSDKGSVMIPIDPRRPSDASTAPLLADQSRRPSAATTVLSSSGYPTPPRGPPTHHQHPVPAPQGYTWGAPHPWASDASLPAARSASPASAAAAARARPAEPSYIGYPTPSELGYAPSVVSSASSGRPRPSGPSTTAAPRGVPPRHNATPEAAAAVRARMPSMAPTVASTDIYDEEFRNADTLPMRGKRAPSPPRGEAVRPVMPPVPVEEEEAWKPRGGGRRGGRKVAAVKDAEFVGKARMRHMSLMTDGGKSLKAESEVEVEEEEGR
ncbi:hypothetical protein HDU96_007048 [Phlyctochytrium bullatum]|nr:hypothetical protein HDU96_007048 [Phlyctochytrium bullatum]